MRLFSALLLAISALAACGKVSTLDNPDGRPPEDSDVPLTCDFAKSGNACAFPPHISIEAARTCLASTTAAVLDPPVGATVSFGRTGTSYKLTCSPNCGGTATEITSQEALFQVSAPLVELFCFQKINIPGGVTVRAAAGFDRAIALLAQDEVTLGGTIDVSGVEADSVQVGGGPGGPGGYGGGGRSAPYDGAGPCGGIGGSPQGGAGNIGAGGGGGGNAGAGGNGGAGNPTPAGAAGGCARPYAKLEGGSGGGGGGTAIVIANGGTNFGSQFAGSGGGGAVAIVSQKSVTVAATGSILANGAQGSVRSNNNSFNYNQLGGTGGGAGGTIVLAAPAVNVMGTLRAQGGNGRVAWGNGGAGATTALNGANGNNGPSNTNGGAGGGGGGGFIRVFSSTGTAECASVASPASGCATSRLPEAAATP